MPELIVFSENDHDMSGLSVENYDVLRDYFNGFLEQDIYETDSVPFSTLLSIYDNLALLFGSKLSKREQRALKYNYDQRPDKLKAFRYSQHTKDWLTANLPAINQDEETCSAEILTDLYGFYQTMKYLIRRDGRHIKSTYRVGFQPY